MRKQSTCIEESQNEQEKKEREKGEEKRDRYRDRDRKRKKRDTHTHTALIAFGRPYGEESLEVVMYNFSLSIHHKYTA